MSVLPATSSTSSSPPQAVLTREQAAAYVNERLGFEAITSTALANKASTGGGPRYRIWGRKTPGRGGRGRFAVYTAADLDEWIAEQFHDPQEQ